VGTSTKLMIGGSQDEKTLVITPTGALYAWGYNGYGQLGNNTTTNQSVPVLITGFGAIVGKTIVAVACGTYHTVALDSAGYIYVWGFNGSGELGSTSIAVVNGQVNIPTLLSGIGGILPLATTAPTAVSFTPFFVNFTGQHRVFVAGTTVNELGVSEGFIVVCDQDDYITAPGSAPIGQFARGQNAITINDALPIVSLAKVAYDKRVFGILSPSVMPLDPLMTSPDVQGQQQLVMCGDVRMEINAIGAGAIWISDANGPLVSGDLITSSTIPGYGQLQTGTFPGMFQNFTVAKITCDCDFFPPQKPVWVVQTDENGLNVVDPVTGWPVRVQEMTTVLIDPATNMAANVAVQRTLITDPVAFQTWFDSLVSTQQPATETPYKMRFILADGTQITEAEYTANMASVPAIPCFRAAFVGCTYHCG